MNFNYKNIQLLFLGGTNPAILTHTLTSTYLILQMIIKTIILAVVLVGTFGISFSLAIHFSLYNRSAFLIAVFLAFFAHEAMRHYLKKF